MKEPELMTCFHCGEENKPSHMELLSDGVTRSNMCKQCWFEYQEKRTKERPALLKKWSQDRKDEAVEADRREAAKKRKKAS